MKTKHTQGNWNYELNKKGDKYKISGGDWYYFAKIHAYAISKDNKKGHKREAKANAKLIAAAPDLLEAAFNMVNISSDNSVANFKIAIADLKAAIKKATE